jgi:hypothetical protein
LTDAQARRVSMAELIRQCIDSTLASGEPDRSTLYERAEVIVGRFEDRAGACDLAEAHDDYLATSFE